MTYVPASGAYTVTPADFDGGCFVRTVNGQRIGTGRNKLGIEVTLYLDTPLCGGCDQPLDNGVCDDCEQVFTDAVERDLRFTMEMEAKRRAA